MPCDLFDLFGRVRAQDDGQSSCRGRASRVIAPCVHVCLFVAPSRNVCCAAGRHPSLAVHTVTPK